MPSEIPGMSPMEEPMTPDPPEVLKIHIKPRIVIPPNPHNIKHSHYPLIPAVVFRSILLNLSSLYSRSEVEAHLHVWETHYQHLYDGYALPHPIKDRV
jgi:hypothetical protein